MSEKDELAIAAAALTAKVEALSDHVKVTALEAERIERQARRTRYLSWVVAALVAVSLAGVVMTFVLLSKVQDTSESNEDNAVTACENANMSRKANLTLWTFVLDASATNPDRTPQQVALADALREWLGKLYAPHDCGDLGREYPLPPPPSISATP
jgi:hypothetical protein